MAQQTHGIRTAWKTWLLYTAILSIVVLGCNLWMRFVGESVAATYHIPRLLVQLAGVFLLAFIFVTLRHVSMRKRREGLSERESSIRERLSSLRNLLAEYPGIRELGRSVLTELKGVLGVESLGLTVYYDQPLAVEVTSIHLSGEDFEVSVQCACEDDEATVPGDTDSSDKMEILPLIFRERLVGLLEIGPGKDGTGLSREDHRHLADLAPVIAMAIDNMMMIRNVSEANQRLMTSEKLASIGQLASGIAHEIRNPLSSMKMNMQGLAKSRNIGERNTRRMMICLDEIDRLDNIVSELIHLSRRSRLEAERTDAGALLEKSVQLAKAELEKRRIAITIRKAENTPTILADEAKLTHALLNLILNAAQAIGENGKIKLCAEPHGRGVELSVEDDGPGIPPRIRRDILNPFFTTKAEGTGLGLPNVLKSVQEHGGELVFSSEEGKGTVFSIRLPETPPSSVEDPSVMRVMPK